MERPVDRRSTMDSEFALDLTSEESTFAGTQMQEMKFTDRPARSVPMSPSAMSTPHDPTSRAGSCVARQNVGDVMKLKLRCDPSKHRRRLRTTADTSYIRARAVPALETGCGARSVMLTWSFTEVWEGRCAFIPVSWQLSRGVRIRGAACSSESSKA